MTIEENYKIGNQYFADAHNVAVQLVSAMYKAHGYKGDPTTLTSYCSVLAKVETQIKNSYMRLSDNASVYVQNNIYMNKRTSKY